MGNLFSDFMGRGKKNPKSQQDGPDTEPRPQEADFTIDPPKQPSEQPKPSSQPSAPIPDESRPKDETPHDTEEVSVLRERCRWLEDQLYQTKRLSEKLSADLAATKSQVDEANASSKELRAQLDSCLQQLKQSKLREQELETALASPDKNTQIVINELSRGHNETWSLIAQLSDMIKQSLENIGEIRGDLLAQLDKTEEKMQRKDSDIQNYQQDTFRKMQTPLIRQFIALGDLMRGVLGLSTPEGQQEATFLREQIEALTESVNHILADFSVEKFTHDNDDMTFNANNQEVVAYVYTDDPDLDKKVAHTVNPGYYWTLPYIIKPKISGEVELPKLYKFVLRNEQVACYRLNQKK